MARAAAPLAVVMLLAQAPRADARCAVTKRINATAWSTDLSRAASNWRRGALRDGRAGCAEGARRMDTAGGLSAWRQRAAKREL